MNFIDLLTDFIIYTAMLFFILCFIIAMYSIYSYNENISSISSRCHDYGYDGYKLVNGDYTCFKYTIEQKIAKGIGDEK